MDLTRINYIKNNLPKTITELYWINDNTNSNYTKGDITCSKVINYKCSFCDTDYNNAIAYTYNPFSFNLLKDNKIYICLDCLTIRIIWSVYEKGRYELLIISIVSKINKNFEEKFTLVNDIEVSNCICNLCKNKKINGYKFKFNEQDEFLCFMCYCNYRKNTKMSMSRKSRNTRKRSNKSTRKRVNKKPINTRKRVNKKTKSTRKK